MPTKRYSDAQITRAIAKFQSRGCTLEKWVWRVMNCSNAQTFAEQAKADGDDRLAALYLAIDRMTYAIQWAQATGRTCSLMERETVMSVRSLLVRMVSVAAHGDGSIDQAYQAWREFSGLWAERHAADRHMECAA